MKPIKIHYVDEWELRDKEDVHPSHRTKVIEYSDMMERVKALKEEIRNLVTDEEWKWFKKSFDKYFEDECIARCLPLDVKQEGGNGVPPTPKECGYPA